MNGLSKENFQKRHTIQIITDDSTVKVLFPELKTSILVASENPTLFFSHYKRLNQIISI